MNYYELKERVKNRISVDEDGLILDLDISHFHLVKGLELFEDSFVIKVDEGFAILPINKAGIGIIPKLRLAAVDEILYLAMTEH